MALPMLEQLPKSKRRLSMEHHGWIATISALCGRRLPKILVGFSLACFIAQSIEPQPPRLAAFKLTPELVSLAVLPEVITVNFTVLDDGPGVTYVEVVFSDASGLRRAASSNFQPTPSLTSAFRIPLRKFERAGEWRLTQVFVADAAGKTAILSERDVAKLGGTTRIQMNFPTDDEKPQLHSIQITPLEVDTRGRAAEVKVRLGVSDNLSGVQDISATLTSPTGTQQQLSATLGGLRSGEGTLTDLFPKLAEPGRWRLTAIFLIDVAGNTLALSEAEIMDLGFRNVVTVVSARDTVAPILTDFQITPNTIDVGSQRNKVAIQFNATDDVSGVAYAEIVLVSPSGTVHHSGSISFTPSNVVNGSVSITLPHFSETGAWRIGTFILSDAVGNTLVLDSDALRGISKEVQFGVVSNPESARHL
jgi:hypothetical protein